MSLAQLVQQPGREHLPYLTPCPKGRRQTWFNRSGNGISAWINNMMYSNLSKGYPTFTHFPAEDQEMWFRQFACIPRDIPTQLPRNFPRDISPQNIPTDTLPRNIPKAKVSRNIPTAEVRRNIPVGIF
ncbi:hypothetical protein F2Q69_00048409 [Brassica cretica]|uniref:Uncharacterized protein n=1 Tax=Brassica cretica TaxID=69181 RepID=A0A8S9PQZ6_BRACR|nr:hypothetical protein F2Q69_00048409 [Brassica cretica]